jgi:hypothetical protein
MHQMPQVGNQTQPQSLQERIAMRAYEKWCRRGRSHGHDQQDWLEAEQEIRNETRGGPSSPGRR